MVNLLSLLKKLYLMEIKKLAIYKTDFIVGVVATAFMTIMSVVFVWVIFAHIQTLNGWSFNEMMFITGFSGVCIGFWHVFLSQPTAHRIERHVRDGSFDRYLLFPVNPLTFITISRFDDDGLGELVSSIVVLIYAMLAVGFQWTLQNIFYLVVLMASSITIIFSLFLATGGLAFKIVRSGEVEGIIYNIFNMVQYPLNIFGPVIVTIFTFFVPLAFVAYYPSQILLQKETALTMLYAAPIAAIASLFVANKIWKICLNKYTSTGS